MYALPALLVCDMNPENLLWDREKPYAAIIDGEQMQLRKTFALLKEHRYITPFPVDNKVKVTDLGTEALRAWNNGEAGL